jgi:hypothetical protein
MNAYQAAYEYATAHRASATEADEFAGRYERFAALVEQGRAITGFYGAVSGPASLRPRFSAGK